MKESELAAIEDRQNDVCQGPWKSDWRMPTQAEHLLGHDVPALIAEVRRLQGRLRIIDQTFAELTRDNALLEEVVRLREQAKLLDMFCPACEHKVDSHDHAGCRGTAHDNGCWCRKKAFHGIVTL